MSDPIDFKAAKDARKDLCQYCGKPAHVTKLACPRISYLSLNEDGYCDGLSFWGDFFDEEETDPAA